MSIRERFEKYEALVHAMQSGVAATMHYDDHSTQPKHLRVGINSAMVETSALAKLLIDKGVINEEEWFDSLNFMMEQEVKRYEEQLSKHHGTDIKLG